MRRILYILALIAAAYTVLTVIVSCARMRAPDGGWYDEVPPRVVSSTPADRAVNVKTNKIEIRFNEFVKVDNATENVVICPPQLEQAEIKTKGKSVIVELKDSLKENTTYTIDFSDAIQDFRENNPMGNYTFTFSTGNIIDTLAVAGYILDAETLEPVKGQHVGLYSNLADSAFTTEPMLRVGRTDASGHFSIRGVAPGKYRIFSLQDTDGDFKLSQRGERLSFSHDIIEPYSKPDTRQDTIWKDSLHISSIHTVPYIHFMPDDICMRAFTQKLTDRYLIKTERKDPENFKAYFSYGSENLPVIRGLNFNDKDAFVVENNLNKDTITYWLRDTMLVNQDTLQIEMTYEMTDSMGNLVSQVDTLEMFNKISYEKRFKARMEALAKWQKKADKAEKNGKTINEPNPEIKFLEPKFIVPSKMSPNNNITLTFPTPLERMDTAGIHLYSKIDTLWYRSPVQIEKDVLPRTYTIKGEWRPGIEYSLEADSAAFCDIYGHVSKALKTGIKVPDEDEFSSLFANISGVKNDTAQIIVQLVDKSGNMQYEAIAKNNTAEFYYLQPGEYYLKVIVDYNRNGKWDTGDYSADLQPEEVYFKTDIINCKAKWDLTTDFNVQSKVLFKQKPSALIKQKGESKKKQTARNAKRAVELGVKYDKEKVDSKF